MFHVDCSFAIMREPIAFGLITVHTLNTCRDKTDPVYRTVARRKYVFFFYLFTFFFFVAMVTLADDALYLLTTADDSKQNETCCCDGVRTSYSTGLRS